MPKNIKQLRVKDKKILAFDDETNKLYEVQLRELDLQELTKEEIFDAASLFIKKDDEPVIRIKE